VNHRVIIASVESCESQVSLTVHPVVLPKFEASVRATPNSLETGETCRLDYGIHSTGSVNTGPLTLSMILLNTTTLTSTAVWLNDAVTFAGGIDPGITVNLILEVTIDPAIPASAIRLVYPGDPNHGFSFTNLPSGTYVLFAAADSYGDGRIDTALGDEYGFHDSVSASGGLPETIFIGEGGKNPTRMNADRADFHGARRKHLCSRAFFMRKNL
jgi:hypothetical protein